jgi:hypothetical protein
MSSNFDIKAIRKIGADLIKVHGLGGEFKSDDIGTLASAHSGEITASQSYEYRITELNDCHGVSNAKRQWLYVCQFKR